MAKNLGLSIRNVSSPGKKAEDHFNRAIESAEEIEAMTVLGRAYLDLGLLYKIKGTAEQASEHMSGAIQIFEEREAEGFLKEAKEAFASLEK